MEDRNVHSSRVLFRDLLDYLRQNGFILGVDSHLRFQKVLARVGDSCTPDELRNLLCPILATDKKQQEFFYSAFDTYLGLNQVNAAPLTSTPPLLPDSAEPEAEPARARRWPYITTALLLIIIIAGTAYYWERQGQINQGVAPQPSPALTPEPPPDFVTPSVTNEPVPELIQPIRWLALITPTLFWLLYEGYLYNRRKLLLNKLSSNYQPHIFPFRPTSQPPHIFASERFYNLTRLLRRRQIADFNLLDIDATINATVKFLGYPVLSFRRASKVPEYLVLIERKTYRDNLSQFFDELVKALESEEIQIARYYYDTDPRVCFKPSPTALKASLSLAETMRDQGEQGVPLTEVLNKHEDCRLLIFGSGEGFVDPLTGDKEDWTSLFSAIKERALLTPVSPDEWSFREVKLADQFLLVPATLDGLEALIDYYELGDVASPQGWMRKKPIPSLLDLDSPDVIALLRAHLGENTFRWLCACAVYPSLQWELTFYLGSLPSMQANLADEQNILRLIGLPWFRNGSIPPPLRQRLIEELPPEIYTEVQRATVGVLGEADPDSKIEADPDSKIIDNIASSLNVAIPRQFSLLLSDGLRKMLHILPWGRVFRDYIFVRFLEAKPNTLMVRLLPRSIHRIFYPSGNTALRMKFNLRILITLLITIAIWVSAPGIVKAVKTERTLTVQTLPPLELATPTPTPSAFPTLSPVDTSTPGDNPAPRQSPAAVTPIPGASQIPQQTPTVSTAPPVSNTTATPTPDVAVAPPAGTPFQPPEPSASLASVATSTPQDTQGAQPTPNLDTAPVCPQVNIIPVSSNEATLSHSFTAKVIGGKVLKPSQYIWSLEYNGVPANRTQGIIVSGQYTRTVDIWWPGIFTQIVVKVFVTGYNAECSPTASWEIDRMTSPYGETLQ